MTAMFAPRMDARNMLFVIMAAALILSLNLAAKIVLEIDETQGTE